jgi:Ca2+-binding RTX toxin-like protein
MRGLKTIRGWKTLDDESGTGSPHLGLSSQTVSKPTGDSDLTTVALTTPLSADTTSTPAALTISNPVIVNAFDTTAFGNPDPSGLAFIPGGTPGTGTLLVPDSEVDETPFFATNNLFYYALSGAFDHSASLESFTIEPTGLAYDSLNGHLFISDDDKNSIFEVDAANPNVKLSSFSVSPFAPDAEDVAFDPVTNHLLIIEGDTANVNTRTIFERTTSGAAVQTISLTNLVPADLEAIAYDPVSQVFYVTGGASKDIYVVSRDGQTLLDTITVLESLTNTLSDTSVHPKGLVLAPSSDPNDDPDTMSLYVADYGRDQVMDGRIYEIQLNGPSPQPALFSTDSDVIDLNQVAAGSYLAGSQYNALAGNDTVTLPTNAAAAADAGYNPVQSAFRSGDGNDIIIGGSLNDTVWGDTGNDIIKGGAGNDRLLGGSGVDVLSGGSGNDFLDGGSGNDTADYSVAAGAITINLAAGTATGEGNDTLANIENATGSDFDDSITGSTVANLLNGAGGNDTLSGGSANDTLVGGIGIDTLSGGDGHDSLKWDGADSFNGGVGFDTLDANLSSSDTIDLRAAGFVTLERILAGSGNDTITVSLSKILSETADHQFVVDAGSGTDALTIDVTGSWTATTPNPTLGPTGVAAGISVSGMTAYTFTDGTNTVTVFTNAETVQYPSSAPPLFTTGNDTVDFNQVVAGAYLAGSQYDALAGNDTVALPIDVAAATAAGYSPSQTFNGGDGHDFIAGGTLNDTISGGNGNDTVQGAAGNDTLTGGSNSDKLDGGAGNDSLNGGSSADVLIGGLGNDLLDGGSSNDTVDYTSSATAVTAQLATGTVTGEGDDTLLNIENVTGSGFDDAITGSSLANVLVGGGGNDLIHGADGDDTLTGGAGLDQLFGEVGHDTLKWDSADLLDGGIGFDTLDANQSSADTIDLRGANFANLERVQTGSGKDVVTLSLNDVLSDTADDQFVADLGGSSPDTLNIDLVGGWNATTSDPTLGPTGVAAGISVAGMTAYTFTNGTDAVTVFSNAEVVNAQIMSS